MQRPRRITLNHLVYSHNGHGDKTAKWHYVDKYYFVKRHYLYYVRYSVIHYHTHRKCTLASYTASFTILKLLSLVPSSTASWKTTQVLLLPSSL